MVITMIKLITLCDRVVICTGISDTLISELQIKLCVVGLELNIPQVS